jgi:predicted HicB family RNase H-like nuclease
MINSMKIGSYDAVIAYDSDIDMLRGEFVSLSGGADFFAKDIEKLKKEGEISLKVFLAMCKEEDIDPEKCFSGKFPVRIDPAIHKSVVHAAKSQGISINKWVAAALKEAAMKKTA